MYNPTTRLLTILELLQTYRTLGGEELARRLEVEPRSVRRYILMLQDMGMPIEAVRGPGGGYQLRPGYKLPPLMFNEEEATAIVLGLLSATRLDLEQSAMAVEGALAKVLRVLPVRARERLSAVTEHLFVTADERHTQPDASLLLDLSEAIHQRRHVAIRYRALDDATSERTIQPYGVAALWGNWYVAAWCCSRRDWRTFRLDRIEHAEVLDAAFERVGTFDMEAFFTKHLTNNTARWHFDLVFHAPLNTVQQKIPAHFGALVETADGVHFEADYGDVGDVARFLVATRLPFTVRAPAELRQELRHIAERIASYAA
jgi:predicted DNA-binding transcriptional regulator YafY